MAAQDSDQQLIHDMKRRVRGMRALHDADALTPEKMRTHSLELLALIDEAADRLARTTPPPPDRHRHLRVVGNQRPDLGGAA